MKAKIITAVIILLSNYCQAQCTWTGAVNTDWAEPGNWDCGRVPTQTDDVIVSAGSPVIAAGQIGRCRNLTKSGFLSAIVFNSATLSIYGNLTYNGGSLTMNAGSNLRFRGVPGATQYITGSAALNVTNFRIDDNTRVILNNTPATTNISGILSIYGKFIIGNKTVTAASLDCSDVGYVVTADEFGVPATIGGLKLNVLGFSGQFKTWFVGPTETTFTPVTITNQNNITEDFTIRVEPVNPTGTVASYTVPFTWHITENTLGGNTITVKLVWPPSSEPDDFNRNSCSLVKTDGINIVTTGYPFQPGVVGTETFNVGNVYNNKTNTGITVFSPWTVTSSFGILPVTLTDFNLQLNSDKKVVLHWTLAAGSNPKYFEILKSSNASNFELLKKIDATSALNYQFTDAAPFRGQNFYQLKITDENGGVKYSNIYKINIEQKDFAELTVFPNPVTDLLQLQATLLKAGTVTIRLINIEGKEVLHHTKYLNSGTNAVTLPVTHLPAGCYMLTLAFANGEKTTATVIKK